MFKSRFIKKVEMTYKKKEICARDCNRITAKNHFSLVIFFCDRVVIIRIKKWISGYFYFDQYGLSFFLSGWMRFAISIKADIYLDTL